AADPDSALASDFSSDLDAELASDFDFASLDFSSLDFASLDFASLPSLSDLAAGLLPELRKSVAYQPLPLSWNPAADTSFTSVERPHAGQTVSGASDSFCRDSSS